MELSEIKDVITDGTKKQKWESFKATMCKLELQ